MAHGYYARAIKLIQRQQEERQTRENDERIIRAMRLLGWSHSVRHFEHSLPVRYPQAYHPF